MRKGRANGRLWLLLNTLSRARRTVTFVQVGSNDADYGDPLREFILRDRWQGVMVEPVPYVFDRLRAKYGNRNELALLNVAIADAAGEKDFFYLEESSDSLPPWYDQLGSFYRENIIKHREQIPDIEQRVRSIPVPCVTLRDLFRQQGVQRLDLFHVDAEGYDYEIIRQLAGTGILPTVVIYEHVHLSDSQREECKHILSGMSYHSFAEGPNTVAANSGLLRWLSGSLSWF